MADTARTNHTTIRYSDEVKELLEGIRGNSFGDKFENVVLEYFRSQEDRELRIKRLDEKIKEREMLLQESFALMSKASNLLRH